MSTLPLTQEEFDLALSEMEIDGVIGRKLSAPHAAILARVRELEELVSELIYNKEDAVSFFHSAIEIDSHTRFSGEEWEKKARRLMPLPTGETDGKD